MPYQKEVSLDMLDSSSVIEGVLSAFEKIKEFLVDLYIVFIEAQIRYIIFSANERHRLARSKNDEVLKTL